MEALVYQQGEDSISENISPQPVSWRYDSGKIMVTFSHADSGLVCVGKAPSVYAKISRKGESLKTSWKKCAVKILGNQMCITYADPQMQETDCLRVRCRYAWADNPSDVTIYNRQGMPVVPFEIEAVVNQNIGIFL